MVQSQSDEAETVLLFLCLFIIYSGTTIFCLIRLLKLHKFNPQWRKAQIFYVLVLLQIALRSVCLLVLATNLNDLSQTLTFLLISIPDSLFLISYILLIWQLASLFFFFPHLEPIFKEFHRETLQQIQKQQGRPRTYGLCNHFCNQPDRNFFPASGWGGFHSDCRRRVRLVKYRNAMHEFSYHAGIGNTVLWCSA